MKRGHFIGMDVHCLFCEIAVVDANGKVVGRQRMDTTIAALTPVLERVPRPRFLVIEEGPLAGWLWRHLRPLLDDLVVSEPRRNRLIAKDGDKDDDIDAEKLAQLLRGGFVKPVHQCASEEQAVFKQQVSLYHYRVRQRVREAQRISALFRQHGVMVRERAFVAADDRAALVKRLPANAVLAEAIALLWQSYDAAVSHEEQWRSRLVKLARAHEVAQRFEALPGFGWIRAATLYAYLDTPWRFRSKAALWKYLGIGLERQRAGACGRAQTGSSFAQEHDPRGGAVGRGPRGKPVCRLAQEVDRTRPVVEAGAAERGAELGGDVVGPVEKRQRVSAEVGRCGSGRVGRGQAVSVTAVV